MYEYDFFGPEEVKNKYFFNWNKFDIPYCDGMGAQGRRAEPLLTEDKTKYYFRGYDNTMAALEYLLEKVDVKNLDTIVVTGCSSGGTTAMYWIQYIADAVKLKGSNATLLGINIGGFLVDYKSVKTNDNDFGIRMKSVYELVNHEAPIINKECLKDNAENPHFCLMSETLIKYIKVPMLLFQAAYDSFMIKDILGIDCHYADYTMTRCTEQERKQIKEIKDFNKGFLQQVAKAKSNLSVWSPSCIFHCFWSILRDSRSFSVDGKTINDVIGEFLASKGEKQILLFDKVESPESRQCN